MGVSLFVCLVAETEWWGKGGRAARLHYRMPEGPLGGHWKVSASRSHFIRSEAKTDGYREAASQIQRINRKLRTWDIKVVFRASSPHTQICSLWQVDSCQVDSYSKV